MSSKKKITENLFTKYFECRPCSVSSSVADNLILWIVDFTTVLLHHNINHMFIQTATN